MDAVALIEQPSTEPVKRKPEVILNEMERRAVIGDLGSGMSVQSVADKYGVHRATIWRIKSEVLDVQPDCALNWKQQLSEQIPQHSVAAVLASVQDRDDVHKAAATAIAHLKGIGALASDGPITNVFFSQARELPANWRDEYVASDDITATDISSGDTAIGGAAGSLHNTPTVTLDNSTTSGK